MYMYMYMYMYMNMSILNQRFIFHRLHLGLFATSDFLLWYKDKKDPVILAPTFKKYISSVIFGLLDSMTARCIMSTVQLMLDIILFHETQSLSKVV